MGSYGDVDDLIVDVRQDKTELSISASIRDDLLSGLGKDVEGEKQLPEMLLWDEEGHKLFEEVNARPQYYVHHDEITLLKEHGKEIVQLLEPEAMIVELGSGSVSASPPQRSSSDGSTLSAK